MLKKITFLFIIFPLLIINQAFAAYPETASDYALLPPYCKARAGKGSPANIKMWKQKIGSAFLHVHHYCASLHSLRLAKNMFPTNKNQQQDKNGLLSAAIGEIEYMESHAEATNILFPYIYTTKAEIYLEANQDTKALEYFNKAINANKKFTKPYALVSDYYKKKGMKKPAREILEAGLKYSPKSKALNKRLKKLSK